MTAAPPESPQVTVAIVAYQSGAFLQPCVDALAAQTYADFEALIIDNDSTDGSIEALTLPDARFRVEKMGANLGFAAANNVAAQAARGEFLVTLNPDTQAAPNWLAELVAATDRWPRAASFGSTQVSLSDPTVLDGVGDVWHVAGVAWRARLGRPIADTPPEGEVFAPCAAAALYRLAPFRELGGFDERFFCYCEDLDLGYRLRLAGWQAVQAPLAIVYHAGSGISGRTSEFTLFHGHRNRVWTYVKNTPGVWMWLLLPYHLAYDALMSYTSHRIGHGWTVARAHLAALEGIGPVLGDRRKVQRARKARTRDLFSAMAWAPKAPMRRDIVRRLNPLSK
jgi:N-acetylglucosaminyl-diphospho-decaprenol L-rhamnosyltransferase